MPFAHLSHILDPKDGTLSSEPTLEVRQDSMVSETGKPSNLMTSTPPNRVGTYMGGPHHFNTTGLDLHELPIGSFAYEGDKVLVVDLPHRDKPHEVTLKEDIEPYVEQLKGKWLLLLRTGLVRIKFTDPHTYEHGGVSIHPEFSKHPNEELLELACIGVDFLSLRSPTNNYEPGAHRQLLGNYTGHIIYAIEDINLEPLSDKKIEMITFGPLWVRGVGSSRVNVMAWLEDQTGLYRKAESGPRLKGQIKALLEDRRRLGSAASHRVGPGRSESSRTDALGRSFAAKLLVICHRLK